MPHASDRATQTIDQLRAAVAKLRHRADLKLKNVTFRIGHMGDHTPEDLERMLAAADEALEEVGYRP